MNCPSRDKVALYVDNELDAGAQEQFAAHLRNCPECTAAVNAQMELKKSLRAAGRAFTAPPELHASVYRALRPQRSVNVLWKWALAPLCVVLLAVVGYLLIPKSRPDTMMARLVDQHVTNLASEHPVDIESSDRHTVKPWFQGKLAFTFTPPELAGTNFKLIGAKLAYAEQRPGAELWYEAGAHKISVFIFQSRDEQVKSGTSHDLSFNVTRWSQGGLDYYLVTDGSQDEAGKLVEMFKQANKS
ncbi:MAG TPA: zf-HC2 domain-containing protein [Candidatus Angelobacter sp.]|nr:zf-HC2 domain-containing protein [Candidatus Angelobacter sp.]